MAWHILGVHLSLEPPANPAPGSAYDQALSWLHNQLWHAGVRTVPTDYGDVAAWVRFYQSQANKLAEAEIKLTIAQSACAAQASQIDGLQSKLEQLGAGKLDEGLRLAQDENLRQAWYIRLLEVDLEEAVDKLGLAKLELERLSRLVVGYQEQFNAHADAGQPKKSAK